MNWVAASLAAGLLDRLLVLALAMALSALLLSAPMRRRLGLYRPSQWLGRVIDVSDRKLNRAKRSTATLVYRGLVVMVAMVLITVLLAAALGVITQHWREGIYLEMLLLAVLLPIRPAAQPPAPKGSDKHTPIRHAIESLAHQFASGTVAVAFWYVVAGIPGALLVRMIHRLDAQIGHISQRYVAFGWAAACMDRILQWLPARLASLLLVLAAILTPKGKPLGALRTLLRDRGNVQDSNHGWPLATTAGALNLTLAGPKPLEGAMAHDAWIGKGTAKATEHDRKRSLWLYAMANGLLWLGVVGVMGAW